MEHSGSFYGVIIDALQRSCRSPLTLSRKFSLLLATHSLPLLEGLNCVISGENSMNHFPFVYVCVVNMRTLLILHPCITSTVTPACAAENAASADLDWDIDLTTSC